ncbi:MAG: D-alanyl-D-alanine carboxypeptidase [Clostridia bacterium]|nr:D-alanyl-D-alanine carboxypeptidase [Clostridia bacterium]
MRGSRGTKWIRRLAAAVAVLTAFVLGCPVAHGEEKPDVSKFPESSVLLSTGEAPRESLNGLEKNADERAYPASITKVLTALVALEKGDLEDLVTISAHVVDLSSANTKIGVKEGEVYSLEDMLYGTLLPSGCDAARAVAECVGGSEAGFAELMNQKAQELGMMDSHFMNASGLHDGEQYTTARDLALLGAAAAENEELCRMLQTREHTVTERTGGRSYSVRNINRLINDPRPGEYEKISALYSWCIGGKTGSTNAAGRTYMAMARCSGVTLICVLLGDRVSTAGTKGTAYDRIVANRFVEAKELFEYGYGFLFPEVSVETLIEKGLPNEFPILVEHGEEQVPVRAAIAPGDTAFSLYRPALEAVGKKGGVTYEVSPLEAAAPVYAGDAAGEVSFYFAKRLLFTVPLVFTDTLLPPATPSPAPVLEVQMRPYHMNAVTPAPVQTPEGSDPGPSPWWLAVPLAAVSGVFLLCLLRRRKARKKEA